MSDSQRLKLKSSNVSVPSPYISTSHSGDTGSKHFLCNNFVALGLSLNLRSSSYVSYSCLTSPYSSEGKTICDTNSEVSCSNSSHTGSSSSVQRLNSDVIKNLPFDGNSHNSLQLEWDQIAPSRADICQNEYSESKLEYKNLFSGSYLKNNSVIDSKSSGIEHESKSLKCSKCGLGFPCTPFACERIKSTYDCDTQGFKFQYSNNSSTKNKIHINNHAEYGITSHKYIDAYNSVGNTFVSECEKSCNSYLPRKRFKRLNDCLSPKDQKNLFSLNNKLLPKYKMQCKNDVKELNSDVKLSKSIKNISAIHDTNTFDSQHSLQTDLSIKDNYNLLHLGNNEILPVKNSISSNSITFAEPQRQRMHLGSLSEGTLNFLNELAASNCTNSFSDNVSGYALSSINSPLLSLKSKKSTLSHINDNHKSDTIPMDDEKKIGNGPNEEDGNETGISAICNTSVESKDVSEVFCGISNEDKSMTTVLHNMSSEIKDVTNILSDISDKDKDVTNILSDISDKDKDVTNILNDISDKDKDVTNILNDISDKDKDVTIILSDISDKDKDVTTSLSNIGDETKIVTSALDLIEQSTLHDRNLSSAEICNSLNQIFNEPTADLSGSTISVVESNQIGETDVNTENNSITLCMNNESEIYLQAIESGISLTADETGTINLSDLSSGNNSEFWQRVLLVQDESGNIETVYLLQDKAEGLSSEISNQSLILENNTENSQTSEGMIIDSTLVNSEPSEVQNLLITQDSINNTENILTLSVNDIQHLGPESTSTAVDENGTSQNNVDVIQDSLTIENFSEESKNQLTGDTKGKISNELEWNGSANVDLNVQVSQDNLNNNHASSLKRSSDDLLSIKEPHSDCTEKPVDISIHKEYSDNGELNNVAESSIHSNESIFDISIDQHSKARKSMSHNLSVTKNSVENLTRALNNVTEKSDLYKGNTTHINGAIYHNESNHIPQTEVQNFVSEKNSSILDQVESNYKPLPKSKKSFHQSIFGRSAKKSLFGSRLSNSLNCSDMDISQTLDENNPEYMKNMGLKRAVEDEQAQNIKRSKTNHGDIEAVSCIYMSKNRTIALKTFKKPFTAAKKSVLDSREIMRNNRNTAMKTFVPKTHRTQSALKTFSRKKAPLTWNGAIPTDNILPRNISEQIARESSSCHSDSQAKVLFQPEICEIRILPNDYVQRASQLLLNAKNGESASTPEDNVSEEEIKLPECTSPVKEFLPLKFHCSCAAEEVPCICNDGNLQLTCEAEDTIDGNAVPCTNIVSQHYLLTPAREIRNRAFCDNHLWRLREHHCCPNCGIFCSQGDFYLCCYEDTEKKENHLFHTNCSIVVSPGLPLSCPHCCKFSNFNPVQLIYRSAQSEQEEVPSHAQNITNKLQDCDIFVIPKPDSEQQVKQDSTVFVPDQKELRVMITSLANEKSFRLRPTGKCLYNPIKTGDTQKVMQLIANGVNPNHKFRSHSNNAPIHVAVYYGWTEILHILLQAGAFIDSVNDDLETPLIVAVERNNLPIVRYLVLAGAQIDVKDCNGMTSFHIASKNGFQEIAEYLYSTGTVDINLQDDGGWTALVWASEHKHVEFVKWLLDIGADPNVRDNEENTVLHWAAYSGKSEIAELLLDKGCTLSYVNKRGDSAMHIAAREDNYECVKFFIRRGAVVDQKNKENKTPLMCCQDDSMSFNYLCQSISSGALKIGKMQLEKHVVFRDISRGAEAYPIQAINEVDDEEFIMEFRYVVKNCHRSGVNINIVSTVNSMQFCTCKDNCVTRDCNCTSNSKCWYDANGCLTSDYDLQNSPVIFECNKTCHCPKTCMNRVVQQGLRCPLQLFRTRYKGWGVRTLQVIPKGAFVCEYVGELITAREATQRDDDTYFFDLESKDSDYCLDGRYYGNVARFLNHSCDPNLVAVKVFVEHQDLNFPRIAFFALRRIQAFEELCFDYGLDFWIVKCQTMLCTCNTQSCKYSKDTIDDTLIKFFKDTRNGAHLESES